MRVRTPLTALGLTLISLLATSRPLSAQWRAEVWLGDAWNAKLPVTITQKNHATYSQTADWSTQPFEPTWYYSMRFSKWKGDKAWAFEYMHHKLYLDNPDLSVIQFLRVTNGVNNLMAERLWRTKGWEYGIAAGPAIVVPISRIRGEVYDRQHGFLHSTYEFGGAPLQGNLARRIKLLPFVYGSLSLKATASYLNVNIADGKAKIVNLALHAQYGISLQAKK